MTGWAGGGTPGAELRGHGCDASVKMGCPDLASPQLVRPWLAGTARSITEQVKLEVPPVGHG